MKRLLPIAYILACLALAALQACNVVGDSVPADSANAILDSLRIVPEEGSSAAAGQQANSKNDPLAGLKPPKVKPHKPRHGDAEPMDFIRVGEEPPSTTSGQSLAAKKGAKKGAGKKAGRRNLAVKAKKRAGRHYATAKSAQRNARNADKTESSSKNTTQNLSTPESPKASTKPRYRFMFGSSAAQQSADAPSQNNNKDASSGIAWQKGGIKEKPSPSKEAASTTAKNAPTTTQFAHNNASSQQAYRGNEADVQAISTKEEIEDQRKLEEELRSASKQTASQLFGRSVTIAITGVDSRLGVSQRHADANHVLRIWLDKGEIEIFSVPRGTPVEAGFSSKALNYLANLRSNKGRDAYLKKMGEITGVGKIDYWVELGFSQAMGVMELLGFKDNAKSALRVLRSRKAFATGDYQRCYNQGQFIRQMILRHFGKSSGFMGGVALRGALGLVETNLKYDVIKAIIEELQGKGFPRNANAVTVHLRPPYKPQIKEIDLSDESAIASLNDKLETKLKKGGYIGKGKAPAFSANKYEDKLETIVDRAERTVQRNPKAAVAALKRVYEQRAWIQLPDKQQRDEYFKKICLTLIEGYELLGFMIDADNVRYFYEQQLQALQHESASK